MTEGQLKKLLVLQACSGDKSQEIANVKSVGEILGIEVKVEQAREQTDLEACLNVTREYDYVYLCAHADVDGFGDQTGGSSYSWDDLASALCRGECLRPRSILLLAACRGGSWQVASQLFIACEEIEYVCGPRWEVSALDIVAAFHVFLYNMEHRREQPSIAAERASRATGYDFFCHDRIEVQQHLAWESMGDKISAFLDAARALIEADDDE